MDGLFLSTSGGGQIQISLRTIPVAEDRTDLPLFEYLTKTGLELSRRAQFHGFSIHIGKTAAHRAPMPRREQHEPTEFALVLRLLLLQVRSESSKDGKALSWPQTAVLKHLDAEGPSMAADLAHAERMKPQSMGT